ncbi:MAG: hypothetical protein DRP74_04645 [Candidatus Omnitrophota bacterium]|nr:MAG: hypothetical protein DRP74_04645 [Candidatus Omnitrophota bacterium]
MFSKIVVCISVLVLAAGLSGCATMGKQKDTQIQGLKNRIAVLEEQLQLKDEEIENLSQEVASLEKQAIVEAKPVVQQAPKKASQTSKTKQIQIALTNAGYNPGPIDGKMGKRTRQAIRDFQRDHNFTVDGKVGKETWGLMKQFLTMKAK